MFKCLICYNMTVILLAALCLMQYPHNVELRVAEDFINKPVQEEVHSSPATPKPETKVENDTESCFRMTREDCPKGPMSCMKLKDDPSSVFCCDVDSFRLKEGLAFAGQNSTRLHILNATIDELDLSLKGFRRLKSMSVTDGNIGKIVGQFPRYSPIACLNISNNNLTTKKLLYRPVSNLFNLTVLDLSNNNLTSIPGAPLSRNYSIDISGNDYIPCKDVQEVMENLKFLNANKTFCTQITTFNWFQDLTHVSIEQIKILKELNASCKLVGPGDLNCTCATERLEIMPDKRPDYAVSVDCSNRNLKQLPTNLPSNTIKLNVSNNNITSLALISDDPSYEHVRQLFADNNQIPSILELEGTKFLDNFAVLTLKNNKLKTIPTYLLSNMFGRNWNFRQLSLEMNQLHCDCTTVKGLKIWLLEKSKNIPDYDGIVCSNVAARVIDLAENKMCQQQRDWTDYIYYIIGAEVTMLVVLVSKVTYDYWVFKTAGYLPWPASKMPKLPCDWLCE